MKDTGRSPAAESLIENKRSLENTYLLYEVASIITSHGSSKFFQEGSWQWLDEIEVKRLIETPLQIFRYPSDIGESW